VIVGIVLAAGSSTRLGRPKQLLPLQGEPLLRETLRRVLASSLDEVIVVLGNYADEIRTAIADLPVGIVVNPNAAKGQSTSVVAGLEALSQDAGNQSNRKGEAALALQPRDVVEAVVFVLGDQPGVEPGTVDALITRWRVSKAPVVAPRYLDGIGNPVLFDRSLFPELGALQGDTGARPILLAHRAAGDLALVPIDQPRPPDVDTEEDYAALVASFEAGRGSCR